ncbi:MULTISPECIES: DNA repair protein [Rhodopseudomonas]|uniref:DNA repair protein n=1 Tax=Rhodopseudomonas palustris TaxID=1076 RepID=A0A0D7EW12_RHOPL|nr:MULTISPECIES: DNA repair protein [Rhodopseudomonas]KIZ43642.1 DNA repair protein [Rhodopseudomonas palustris]MDF3813050.1 DNA repair protein [Rhodopseudomonas sp. BAL398]WOK20055.1 DNA repair protein [Rhodopseudomonas sp. BAL398]
MMSARLSALADLRGDIERIESNSEAQQLRRVALGHAEADAALQGGLARGALHEVFAEAGRHGAAATGFVAGLARRIGTRPLLWVRQDFAERESGALSPNGFGELGLDPRLLVTVHAPDAEAALRAAADALACDALGCVVLEIWGESRHLDLVASRKLTLAARGSGVTGLVLRVAATPLPSSAETRWIVRAAHSPPRPGTPPWQQIWGAPVLETALVRNRHGPNGRWIMEWKCDECLFRDAPAHPQPVAAAPADRPPAAAAIAWQRRAG